MVKFGKLQIRAALRAMRIGIAACVLTFSGTIAGSHLAAAETKKLNGGGGGQNDKIIITPEPNRIGPGRGPGTISPNMGGPRRPGAVREGTGGAGGPGKRPAIKSPATPPTNLVISPTSKIA
jgi:hypothetical protein